MKNKRGVSTIVGTMLVVLLTIVAAGILWIVISKLSNTDNGSSQDCLTLDLEILSCGYAQAGCYQIGGRNLQIPDPAQATTTTTPSGIAWAVIRRNYGHGELETARFILEINGKRVAGKIINYTLPWPISYKARMDFSGLKEFATTDTVSIEAIEKAVSGNIYTQGDTVSATIAPVVKGGIVCDPNPKLVNCNNLGTPVSCPAP